MYNKTILVGNLARDIELRYSGSGMAIAKSAIATSRKFTSNGEKKEEVMFIDITFFGRAGEVANQFLRKGSKVLIEGRIVLDQWTDQNGNKRSKHQVVVETMQMLDSKGDSANQRQNVPQEQAQAPQYEPRNDRGATGTYGDQGQVQEPQYEIRNDKGATGVYVPATPAPVPEIDIDEDEIPF